MTLGYPKSHVILGLKGQRSRSQDHKVQKGFKDGVVGVSYALYRVHSL